MYSTRLPFFDPIVVLQAIVLWYVAIAGVVVVARLAVRLVSRRISASLAPPPRVEAALKKAEAA